MTTEDERWLDGLLRRHSLKTASVLADTLEDRPTEFGAVDTLPPNFQKLKQYLTGLEYGDTVAFLLCMAMAKKVGD